MEHLAKLLRVRLERSAVIFGLVENTDCELLGRAVKPQLVVHEAADNADLILANPTISFGHLAKHGKSRSEENRLALLLSGQPARFGKTGTGLVINQGMSQRCADQGPEVAERGRSAFLRSAASFYLAAKERLEVDEKIAAAYGDQADTMTDEVAEFMDVQQWPKS